MEKTMLTTEEVVEIIAEKMGVSLEEATHVLETAVLNGDLKGLMTTDDGRDVEVNASNAVELGALILPEEKLN